MICVKNFSGFLSVSADGSWVCEMANRHKKERHPDPVSDNLCSLHMYIETFQIIFCPYVVMKIFRPQVSLLR